MPTNLFDKRLDDDEYTHEDVIEDRDEDESEALDCFDRPSSGKLFTMGH
jgi:hypothetical protein